MLVSVRHSLHRIEPERVEEIIMAKKARSKKAVVVILTSRPMISACWATVSATADVQTETWDKAHGVVANAVAEQESWHKTTLAAFQQLYAAGQKTIPVTVRKAMFNMFRSWLCSATVATTRVSAWKYMLNKGNGVYAANPYQAKKKAEKKAAEIVAQLAATDVNPKQGCFVLSLNSVTSEAAAREALVKFCRAVQVGNKSEGINALMGEILACAAE